MTMGGLKAKGYLHEYLVRFEVGFKTQFMFT